MRRQLCDVRNAVIHKEFCRSPGDAGSLWLGRGIYARLNIGKRPDLGDEESAWSRAA